MQHVVIGAGEVGVAVAEVLTGNSQYEVFLRDIRPFGPTRADVIHICFPYYEEFEAAVRAYQRYYEPQLTIVHSTVPVGTCDSIPAVHSPIRGKHPRLAESIKTFEKFFGGIDSEKAAEIFEKCGVKTAIRLKAADTEAGKLWELAQYGLNIFIEKHIHQWCQEHGLDFETVYTDFAVTYNAGYKQLGDSQFIRPILKHVPGPIGGHCVVPGSMLLADPLADLVAQAGLLIADEIPA